MTREKEGSQEKKRGAATALPLFKEPPRSALSLLLRSSSRCLVKFGGGTGLEWAFHPLSFSGLALTALGMPPSMSMRACRKYVRWRKETGFPSFPSAYLISMRARLIKPSTDQTRPRTGN